MGIILLHCGFNICEAQKGKGTNVSGGRRALSGERWAF